MKNQTATKKYPSLALKIALAAIFAALVAVATILFVIPIPATSGYFNLGETIIYIAALLFGPFVGAIAGAGASLSDVYLGYGVFAPGTLIIKGLEGAIVGLLFIKLQKYIKNTTVCAAIAVVVGGSEMVLGYFLYEQFVLGYPFLQALAEVPGNIVQMLVGLIVAIPVMHAVRRIFPQLKSYL
jgi:Predicted membrane protein